MTASAIEWTDETWNPVRGCSRISPGCEHCYAERQAIRQAGPGKPYEGLVRTGKNGPRWTGKLAFDPVKLGEPLRWREPRRVFVNSMSDLFHPSLTDEQIAAVFGVMAASYGHTFQVLTKRADRMEAWFEWVKRRPAELTVPSQERSSEDIDGRVGAHYKPALYCQRSARRVQAEAGPGTGKRVNPYCHTDWPLPNVWIGVSVEDQKRATERLDRLARVPAVVRFASAEPLLEEVDLGPWLRPVPGCGHVGSDGCCAHPDNLLPECHRDVHCPAGKYRGLDWVIVGGESGPGARRFDVMWARRIVDNCRASQVPVFVKQLGANPMASASASSISVDRKLPGGGRLSLKMASFESSTTLCLRDGKGGDPSEWPEDLRVREYPDPRRPR